MGLRTTMWRSASARRMAATIAGIAALASILIGSIPGTVAAGASTTRFVDDDRRVGRNGCNGQQLAPRRIQRAIDDSSPGDRILICPGTYVGQVFVDKDDLTIRAVHPWTARILPAVDHPTNSNLINIDGVRGTTLQWLEIVARTAEPCEQVGGLVLVSHAPGTRVRANRMDTLGGQTFGGCGYETGVRLVNQSDDSVIAWNTIIDFKVAGIEGRDSTGLDVHGNSARFLHANHAPLGFLGQAGIVVQGAPGARVAANVVRSLPTAGVTTPSLGDGILVYGSPANVLRNRVLYAQSAIGLLVHDGSVVRGNTVRHALTQGIVLGSVGGTLVTRNVVSDGGGLGMYAWDTSTGNTIEDNDFRGQAGYDCRDDSQDGGTDGTANTWTNDYGLDADPAAICFDPAST